MKSLTKRNIELAEEVDLLSAWKASAMAVMDGINLQEVGKELGVGLGQDIGPKILPGIRDLKARIEKAENDIRDWMIT